MFVNIFPARQTSFFPPTESAVVILYPVYLLSGHERIFLGGTGVCKFNPKTDVIGFVRRFGLCASDFIAGGEGHNLVFVGRQSRVQDSINSREMFLHFRVSVFRVYGERRI